MNFGEALDALKSGKSVAREGWNGKGLFIYLNEGSFDFSQKLILDIPEDADIKEKVIRQTKLTHIDGIRVDLFGSGDTGTYTRLPNLNMRAATGATVTGWLASQTDLLAEDWTIADRPNPVPA